MIGVRTIALLLALNGEPLALTQAPRPAFDEARLAPRDLSCSVHIEGASALRAELSGRPLGRLLCRSIHEGEIGRAWGRLAEAAQLDEGALFDLWLGRRFTIFVRGTLGEGGGEGGQALDWALLTEVEPEPAQEVLTKLRAKRHLPLAATARAELPSHDLRLASEAGRYLIGPLRSGRLFDEVLARIDGVAPPGTSLADEPALAALAWSAGAASPRAAVVILDQPFGGWSIALAELAGDEVRIRHAGRFDAPPFGRAATRLVWDRAPLAAFEGRALAAVMEPADIGAPFGEFLEITLDVPLMNRSMRENAGACRILALGEVEGRREPDAMDMLLPAGTLCVAVEDARRAETDLDEHICRLLAAIERLGAGRFTLAKPDAASLRPGEIRHVDLSPAIDLFAADLALARGVSLNWTVASGPHGSYMMIGSHADELREAVHALERAPRGPETRGQWASCGTVDGRRVATHLRSWGEKAMALAAPGFEVELAESIETVALLLDGCDRCRWQLARPSANEMRLDVQITLSRDSQPCAPEQAKKQR